MMENNTRNSYCLEWKTVRRDWPLWLLMAGLLISAIVVYPHLPERVPGHWNIHGEVDDYYSRSFGAFFPPLMAIGLYLMMLFFPLIDPQRGNYRRFTGAYTFLRWGLVVFFGVFYVATILVALGYQIDIALAVKAMVSVLFIIIGNFMGQFRHNYFVGIKTPWTLASEAVWRGTHRLGGRIWVVGGLVCLAVSFVNSLWGAVVFFTAIMFIALTPIVYSYFLFKKLSEN
ncbi:MAG: SdpI family protein [Syntrophomonas sp.]